MTRKERHEDYEGFVEKFKPKKTTDDCYTPPAVYEAVLSWVDSNIAPLKGMTIRRPFKPGGDYQAEAKDYGENDVVIDNPPFSILAEIVRFYSGHNIRFFLFAPFLSLFAPSNIDRVTAIVANARVTYDNGAKVPTSFLTNMEGVHRIIVDGPLGRMLSEVSNRAVTKSRRIIKAKSYPMELMTAARLGKLCNNGAQFKVPMDEAVFVSRLDNQSDSRIYGGGYLVSEKAAAEKAAAEKAAAEKAAAEKAAAEKAAAERIELSPREREIIRNLSK